MVKLCRLWPGHVNYGLLKISSFKIKREFMYVMYNFLNKLIFRKTKRLIALKTLSKSINFNKTPLGETGCLANPYFLLTGCLGMQFFDSPPYPSTCVTYRIPCHVIGHQVHSHPILPREAEDFPRGDKHSKHVPLPTYLIYFSPNGSYLVGPIYMPKPPHRTLTARH